MNVDASNEVSAGDRFAFGDNWARFLSLLNQDRIDAARESLQMMLGIESLEGKTFVDAGSGSGLFSLAARLLGAKVTSFDFDPQSVACTNELKRRYFDGDTEWTITGGSVLDREFLLSLGTFDVVYSWGVLHHTGDMWVAIDSVQLLAKPTATLFISLYNDQGQQSSMWKLIKREYNRRGPSTRKALVAGTKSYFAVRSIPRRAYAIAKRTEPIKYKSERGMDMAVDWTDWVGGWPFEVARPGTVFERLHEAGWQLDRLKTVGPYHGCNEFVFSRTAHQTGIN